MPSFHFIFQISKKIIFEVNYWGLNETPYFSTQAAEFNQNRSDYVQCGQAQEELLKYAYFQ